LKRILGAKPFQNPPEVKTPEAEKVGGGGQELVSPHSVRASVSAIRSAVRREGKMPITKSEAKERRRKDVRIATVLRRNGVSASNVLGNSSSRGWTSSTIAKFAATMKLMNMEKHVEPVLRLGVAYPDAIETVRARDGLARGVGMSGADRESFASQRFDDMLELVESVGPLALAHARRSASLGDTSEEEE